MTLTLEPLDGPQTVTVRCNGEPVVPVFKPRETAAEHAARMDASYARARALFQLAPVERRRNRGRA